MPKDNDKEIRCSFCGKTQSEVTRLIEGDGVYICDNCISFCNSLLFDDEKEFESKKSTKTKDFVLPKPAEIKAKLDEYVIGQDSAKKRFQLRSIIITNAYTRTPTAMWNLQKAMCLCSVLRESARPSLHRLLQKYLMFRLL